MSTNNNNNWTGDVLTSLLASMNPVQPSHRELAEEIQALVAERIETSSDGKSLGSFASVLDADPASLSPFTADLCLDYRAVRMFLA